LTAFWHFLHKPLIALMLTSPCAGTGASSYNLVPNQEATQAGISTRAAGEAALIPVGAATAAAASTARATGNQGSNTGSTHPVSASHVQSLAQSDGVITLGNPITVSGSGATVTGSTVNITAAGSYSISGNLSDGQIVVDTKDKDPVTLVLNGASITSSTSASIYVKDAEAVVIVLAEGSENYVADGTAYTGQGPETGEPDAAIFSKADLSIEGSGSLAVHANYNDAIASKDGLEITAGNITVDAPSDGIRGRDYFLVKGGGTEFARLKAPPSGTILSTSSTRSPVSVGSSTFWSARSSCGHPGHHR